MKMTFSQYIDNPMGKKNAVFSQRGMYKNLYTEKFDRVFLREAGKINYTLYFDKKKDIYVIHVKVPSETVPNFYYDAVIMFHTSDPAIKASNSLENYDAKFFSNDPAFVFTYLRVFLKNDLFIEDLKPNASSLALRKDPKEKNPYEVPGYSKILYFAYLFMKAKNLFAKHMYETYGVRYSKNAIINAVEHTDIKIARRQELGAKASKEKSTDEASNRTNSTSPRTTVNSPSGNVRTTKMTNRIKSANTTKRTKTTKTTKRSK